MNTEATMSPADILATMDDSAERMEKMCRDFLFRESISAPELKRARTAVAALIEREAALIAERDELADELERYKRAARVATTETLEEGIREYEKEIARAEARNV